MIEAELALDARAHLGEGPVWDDETGLLYWFDILNRKLHCFHPGAGPMPVRDTSIDLGLLPGSIALRQNGGFILAAENGFYFIDIDRAQYGELCQAKARLTFVTGPEADRPDNRFNDGKCDPAGRFFAGTMRRDGSGVRGAFYRIDSNLRVNKIFDGVSISNGLAWSLDTKTMYYINTPVKTVWAFDYDLETGEISNKRAAVHGENEEGIFDGMSMDVEGTLWVAHFGGYKVSGWDPNSGKKIAEIAVPVPNPTSCTFGGEKIDTLFITTARLAMTEEDLARYPESGGLFAVKPGVKGLPTHRFGG